MNRKIYFSCTFHKLISPPSKFFSFPGSYGAFVNTQPFVRDHQVTINSQHLRKTFAGWASAKGIIKIEKIGNRFFKRHSIQFKPIIEMNNESAV